MQPSLEPGLRHKDILKAQVLIGESSGNKELTSSAVFSEKNVGDSLSLSGSWQVPSSPVPV